MTISFVQSATGVAPWVSTSSPLSVTNTALGATPTAGNLLVIGFIDDGATALTLPTGFRHVTGSPFTTTIAENVTLAYGIVGVSGLTAATQYTVSWATTGAGGAMWVEEWASTTGWLANPLDVVLGTLIPATTLASWSSKACGPTAAVAQTSELAIAAAYIGDIGTPTTYTPYTYTGGFTSRIGGFNSGTSTAHDMGLGAADQILSAPGTLSSTFGIAATDTQWYGYLVIATFRPANSASVPTPAPIPAELILAQYGITPFMLQPSPLTLTATVTVNGTAADTQMSVAVAAGQGVNRAGGVVTQRAAAIATGQGVNVGGGTVAQRTVGLAVGKSVGFGHAVGVQLAAGRASAVTVVSGGAVVVQRSAARAAGVTVIAGSAVIVQRGMSTAAEVGVDLGHAVGAQRALGAATGIQGRAGGGSGVQQSRMVAAAVVVCVGVAVAVQRARNAAGATQVNNGHASGSERWVGQASPMMIQLSTAVSAQRSRMVARGVSVTPNTASTLMFDVDTGKSVYRLGTSPLVIELQ